MSDDLISRRAAVDALIAQANHEGAYGYIDAKEAEDVLMALPTVGVPDRKVGEWIWMGDKGDSRWMCSVCKSKEDVPTIMGKPIVWDYCPNCGARMKGEDDAEVH